MSGVAHWEMPMGRTLCGFDYKEDTRTSKRDQVTCTSCDAALRHEEGGGKPDFEGRKSDADKPRWDLVQPLWLREYVDVLTFGAKKYAPDNWRKVEGRRSRYFAAALRHLFDWWGGEQRDPETGLHHLAHAACCIAFLAEEELEEG